jgi:hypothetical protein
LFFLLHYIEIANIKTLIQKSLKLWIIKKNLYRCINRRSDNIIKWDLLFKTSLVDSIGILFRVQTYVLRCVENDCQTIHVLYITINNTVGETRRCLALQYQINAHLWEIKIVVYDYVEYTLIVYKKSCAILFLLSIYTIVIISKRKIMNGRTQFIKSYKLFNELPYMSHTNRSLCFI